MRITQRIEADILETLSTAPATCITFPESAYRTDGSVLIHRNNRSIRLHRYLAAKMGAPVPRGVYLHRTCKTPGCMNPFHHTASRRSSVGRNAVACINGHPYTKASTLATGRYRCRICRDERNARRRTGNARSGLCGAGVHLLTPANVYMSTDVSGRVHRRCRPCTIERMRMTRRNGDTDGNRRPDRQGQGTARSGQRTDQGAGAVVALHG